MEVWICLECIGSNGDDSSCHYELECLSSTYQRGVEIVVKSEYFTVSHLDTNGICPGFQIDGPKIPKLTPWYLNHTNLAGIEERTLAKSVNRCRVEGRNQEQHSRRDMRQELWYTEVVEERGILMQVTDAISSFYSGGTRCCEESRDGGMAKARRRCCLRLQMIYKCSSRF